MRAVHEEEEVEIHVILDGVLVLPFPYEVFLQLGEPLKDWHVISMIRLRMQPWMTKEQNVYRDVS